MAMWPWAPCWILLSLSFFLCKRGVILCRMGDAFNLVQGWMQKLGHWSPFSLFSPSSFSSSLLRPPDLPLPPRLDEKGGNLFSAPTVCQALSWVFYLGFVISLFLWDKGVLLWFHRWREWGQRSHMTFIRSLSKQEQTWGWSPFTAKTEAYTLGTWR